MKSERVKAQKDLDWVVASGRIKLADLHIRYLDAVGQVKKDTQDEMDEIAVLLRELKRIIPQLPTVARGCEFTNFI